jgi:hypothetical protein
MTLKRHSGIRLIVASRLTVVQLTARELKIFLRISKHFF